VLREQEAGATTADVCRKHGISSATFYAWKVKFGGMEVSDAKRLSRMRPLKASQMPFCMGLPGAMKCQSTFASSPQVSMALEGSSATRCV
jgi:putative transposase